MKKALLSSIAVLILTVLLTGFLGCSRKERAAEPSLLQSALLTRLPNDVLAFAVWNNALPAAKRFHASPWAGGGVANLPGASQKLEELAAISPEAASIQKMLEVFGLKDDLQTSSVVKEAVAYLGSSGRDSALPYYGIVLSAQSGVEFAKKIEELKEAAAENFEVSDYDYGEGIKGFSLRATGMEEPLYLAAREDLLALGNRAEVSQRLQPVGDAAGLPDLVKSSSYQRAVAELQLGQGEFAFFYADLAAALNIAFEDLPKEFLAEKEDLSFVQAIAGKRGMEELPHDRFILTLDPSKLAEDNASLKALKELSPRSRTSTMEQIPGNAVLALGLDGALLSFLVQLAEADSGEGEETGEIPFNDLLAKIDAFTLALRSGEGASPFPELALVIQSANPGDMQQELKEAIDGAVTMGLGFPLQWQEKEIAGTKVSFAISPMFGIGVFLGALPGEGLVVATSESFFQGLAKGAKQPGLLEGFSSSVKAKVGATTPLFYGYLAFDQAADLVKGLQQSLPIFTGGASADLPLDEVEALRDLGGVLLTLSKEEGVVRIDNNYRKRSDKTRE